MIFNSYVKLPKLPEGKWLGRCRWVGVVKVWPQKLLWIRNRTHQRFYQWVRWMEKGTPNSQQSSQIGFLRSAEPWKTTYHVYLSMVTNFEPWNCKERDIWNILQVMSEFASLHHWPSLADLYRAPSIHKPGQQWRFPTPRSSHLFPLI